MNLEQLKTPNLDRYEQSLGPIHILLDFLRNSDYELCVKTDQKKLDHRIYARREPQVERAVYDYFGINLDQLNHERQMVINHAYQLSAARRKHEENLRNNPRLAKLAESDHHDSHPSVHSEL